MKKLMNRSFVFFIAVSLLLGHAALGNITYEFGHIVESGDTPAVLNAAALVAPQLSVTVSDLGYNAGEGKNQVGFLFTNTWTDQSLGLYQCTITDVYFDDQTGALVDGIFAVIDDPDPTHLVDFESGASPGNLPAGELLTPPFDSDFEASSVPSPVKNGVDPGESVEIVLNLASGRTYYETIWALNSQSDLRIGLHVQNMGPNGDWSEGYVNIPAPGAVLLATMGATSVGWLKRRRTL